MDYVTVRNAVESVVSARKGMVDKAIVAELTGMFLNRAFLNDISEETLLEYFDLVKTHTIKQTACEVRFYGIEEMVSEELMANPMFFITEFDLMEYRPGKSQTSPGEFFFCWYDCNSEFSVSSTCGFDVVVDGVKMEFKKIGSNFTSDAKFDEYADKNIVEQLVVVKPVSDAKKPKFRSKVIFADINNWRAYVKHNNNEKNEGGLKAAF